MYRYGSARSSGRGIRIEVTQRKRLWVVDDDDVELPLQAPSILLYRREIYLAFRLGKPASLPLQIVVDFLGDREESFIAIHDLPLGRQTQVT
jgi:hypothetical protein